MKINVLGVDFDNMTKREAVEYSMRIFDTDISGYVVTPNPEIVMMCREDERLANAVREAALVIPDGIGIIYGAKILKRPLKERVPGVDYISGMFSEMAKKEMSVFLLGSKPGIAEKAGENIAAKYRGLKICGTADGYFKDDAPVIRQINAAKPDLLLVCLGAPKQEYWMRDNFEKLNVKLMAGLGGSLDVFAGAVKRAPKGWQKLGLEWLYRLLREPRRITRMIKLPFFLLAVLRQRISK